MQENFATHFIFTQAYTFCPGCGKPDLDFDNLNRYFCNSCQGTFYMNTAAACGAILTLGQKILLLQRGKEPALGKYDFPGGFIDPGESAEQALNREIFEETKLLAHNLQYFCSFPNRYLYKNVEYPTCDMIFTGIIDQEPLVEDLQASEISGFILEKPEKIDPTTIAFPSLRQAFLLFRDKGFIDKNSKAKI